MALLTAFTDISVVLIRASKLSSYFKALIACKAKQSVSEVRKNPNLVRKMSVSQEDAAQETDAAAVVHKRDISRHLSLTEAIIWGMRRLL